MSRFPGYAYFAVRLDDGYIMMPKTSLLTDFCLLSKIYWPFQIGL